MRDMERVRVAAGTDERTRAILAKPYWDYEETALVLNVTVKTMRNLKWKREISFTRLGRKVYFPRDVILREMRKNLVLCPGSARGQSGRRAG